MAKRRATSPPSSGSDTIHVAPQKRSIRQKVSHPASPPAPNRTLGFFECVLIPNTPPPTIDISYSATHQASIQPATASESSNLPKYERPFIAEGKRSRKPVNQGRKISDFFTTQPRTAPGQAPQVGSQSREFAHTTLQSHSSSIAPSENGALVDSEADSITVTPLQAFLNRVPQATNTPPDSGFEEASCTQDEEVVPEAKAVHDSGGKRPRRSAARQSYAFDAMELDSEDDLAKTTPAASRRQNQKAKVAPAVESDFEDEHEEEEDEDDGPLTEADEASHDEENDSEGFSDNSGINTVSQTKRKGNVNKKSAKPSGSTTARGVSKTGKQTGKATSNGMHKLLNRQKGEPKGLDTSLPPLASINDIFEDITAKALKLGLRKMLEERNPGPIRVATMCSGTESPLLALEMVQDALQNVGASSLELDHLFSAEIVPYKQAYIERNFHPKIIFRDISEITTAVDEVVPTATTVYGSRIPIPGNVHILIAGTSCVDFSNLNKHRKDLDQENGGESSKTWFGVLSYVKAFRPAIVILENVKNGPYDRMMECYREIGYEVGGVLLDTKNFYLPQTRQRGYLVCFDKSKANVAGEIKGAGKKWEELMSKFRRYASSSVADFMLPSNQVSQQYANLDDYSKEYDWAACEIRHIQYRQSLRLGNGRPLTFWSESGTMNVPENGSLSWYRKQPERVRDYMDIALLRKAALFDVRHKTRVWDVSQNVDMFTDGSQFGITPCITPSGLFFVSDAGRAFSPEEALSLQGLPLNKVSFTTETGSEVQDLAGNAMSTTAVGPAIVAALICGQSVLQNTETAPTLAAASSRAVESKLTGVQTGPVLSAPSCAIEVDLNMPDLLTTASQSARRCLCEGSAAIAQKPIQQCIDCGHTTCTRCGGNPTHRYQLASLMNKTRTKPIDFEQQLRSHLPMQLSFSDGASDDCVSAGSADYLQAVKTAFQSSFNFSQVRRTHHWTAFYQSHLARLELEICDSASWRLFALPNKALPVNSELRILLQQPIAIAKCTSSLLDGLQWQWRIPIQQTFPVRVTGIGPRIGSWLARLELPDYRSQQVWSGLRVEMTSSTASASRGYELAGEYQALPLCGTSNDSLYKKVGPPHDEQIYLLRDPTRTGNPKLDRFVFSTEKERLDFGVQRPFIASLDPAWTPWAEGKAFESTQLSPAGVWLNLPAQLCEVDAEMQLHAPPSYASEQLQLDCTQAELIMKCSFPTPNFDRQGRGPHDVAVNDERFFTQHAHVFEMMRRQLPTSEWRDLPMEEDFACHSCAPPKPGLRWKLNGAQLIKPYEDPATAATYERSIKSRPQPMLFQVSGDEESSTIQFGLNLASLAHRATTRLPAHHATKLTWRLDQSSASSFSRKPFTLRSTEGRASPGDIGMSCQLFPKQAVVLQWMQQQERGIPFTIEEAEEVSNPALGWRAEMRAATEVNVRGGICADHPGFGKTITSLALIHSQLSTGQDNLSSLRERQVTCEAASGLIPTQATLIVAPHTLMKQWASEIKEKLRYSKSLLTISTMRDLDKYRIEDFENAKIILVNRSVLGNSEYAERIANFSAMPGPATNSGRAFSQWLKHATKEVPAHLEILRNEGLKALQSHVKSRYAELITSEDFKAVVPSRRLVGKDFMESKSKTTTKIVKGALKEIPVGSLHRPLFEQFYFNRMIVDEFHQYDPRENAAIKALQADKRWGLSGTPALTDFYDIAQIAGLLGIPLRIGSDSGRVMAQRNLKALRSEMTDFERFDAMREMPSDCMHARIHEIAQGFLDTFVRQNVMDFDEMVCEEHLVPVTLDIDHQAACTELSQQLASQEMNIRKAKKSKTTTRDKRFMAAIADVDTAEEALSRDAAYSARNVKDNNGLEHMVVERQSEVDATLKDLRSACHAAQHGVEALNQSLQDMADTLLHQRMLGDQETIDHVKHALESTAKAGAFVVTTTKQRKKKNVTSESDDEDAGEKEKKVSQKEIKATALTAQVNALAKGLLTSIRSLRYISNVRLISSVSASNERCDSDACLSGGIDRHMAVSALCGHRVCKDCYAKSKEQHATQCAAKGCTAPQHDHHLLWSNTLSNSDQASRHGAKFAAALDLLRGIKAQGEKAIVFVQYGEQLDQAKVALAGTGISSTVVSQQAQAGQQIADFRDNNDTVIVLNASDETAAGSNLQVANHVIFLSPLLRDNQYGYDSTMAQAIGRVRRHGQTRPIHVYRICALHTIDVDILEHREHRTTAMTEADAPTITPPMAAMELDQNDPPKGERVQLVKENRSFSLRPRPWLYMCGTENVEGEMARVKGRDRVAGWEDFSSQIKFSRAFAGGE